MSPRKALVEQGRHHSSGLFDFLAWWRHQQAHHGQGRLAIDGHAYHRRTRRRRNQK